MNMYRTLEYENLNGERLHMNIPDDTFLYDLGGSGFEYSIGLAENNYTDNISVTSVLPVNIPVSGTLTIEDAAGDNTRLYEKLENAARILNYDQLVNRQNDKKVFGRLKYQNARGVRVYTPALVQAFSFGEINDEGEKNIPVQLTMQRGSNVWISQTPITTIISMVGQDDAHRHPYGNPWHHGITYRAGNGSVSAVKGTDLGKLVIKVHGEVRDNFQLTFAALNGLFSRTIVYTQPVLGNKTLTIDTINVSADLDGENVIGNFDFRNGDSPFFGLLPNTDYRMSLVSATLQGSVEIEIYETWVTVP